MPVYHCGGVACRSRQQQQLARKRREYLDMVPEFYDIENSQRTEDEIGALRQVCRGGCAGVSGLMVMTGSHVAAAGGPFLYSRSTYLVTDLASCRFYGSVSKAVATLCSLRSCAVSVLEHAGER